jgi:hypothetical protein
MPGTMLWLRGSSLASRRAPELPGAAAQTLLRMALHEEA